jgi:hypothetical protein
LINLICLYNFCQVSIESDGCKEFKRRDKTFLKYFAEADIFGSDREKNSKDFIPLPLLSEEGGTIQFDNQ